MIEHVLLPLTLIISYYYPWIFFFIFLSSFFISLEDKDIQNIKYDQWITKIDIYRYVNKLDLYKILKYIEERKHFWKKSPFKNEKNGMDKYIEIQIDKIKNKNKNLSYLTEVIIMYIYIAREGIINKIPDIEIIENMHNIYQNIMVKYRILDKKNMKNFKDISVKKKYIYQLYLSAVFEELYCEKII